MAFQSKCGLIPKTPSFYRQLILGLLSKIPGREVDSPALEAISSIHGKPEGNCWLNPDFVI